MSAHACQLGGVGGVSIGGAAPANYRRTQHEARRGEDGMARLGSPQMGQGQGQHRDPAHDAVEE
jgi:hypothetical protein